MAHVDSLLITDHWNAHPRGDKQCRKSERDRDRDAESNAIAEKAVGEATRTNTAVKELGEAASRKLNFYFPAAMTGYFDDLAAALARSDVTDAELAEIAEAHRMRVVGPPSERYV